GSSELLEGPERPLRYSETMPFLTSVRESITSWSFDLERSTARVNGRRDVPPKRPAAVAGPTRPSSGMRILAPAPRRNLRMLSAIGPSSGASTAAMGWFRAEAAHLLRGRP